MKLNISAALDWLKFPSYIALLIGDIVIVFLSFQTSIPNPDHKIIVGVVGCIIALVSAMAFLRGVRAKGFEKFICFFIWACSVVLIVLINWSYITVSARAQTAESQEIKNTETLISDTKAVQIKLALDNILALNKKLSELNRWQEKERNSISEEIKTQNDLINSLNVKSEDKIKSSGAIEAMQVFEKMSTITGGNKNATSDWWWIGLFFVAQVLTVIAAPKSDDKRPRRKHVPRIQRDVSMRRLVEWWVSTNWMGIRTGKSRTMLPRESFDKFTTERWQPFPGDKYDAILQAANRTQIIDGAEIREADEATAIKRILANVGKQKADQPELF
jgi:hypothetical protein